MYPTERAGAEAKSRRAKGTSWRKSRAAAAPTATAALKRIAAPSPGGRADLRT
jgi:hypothetical protein